MVYLYAMKKVQKMPTHWFYYNTKHAIRLNKIIKFLKSNYIYIKINLAKRKKILKWKINIIPF